jgi:hypothetical protein
MTSLTAGSPETDEKVAGKLRGGGEIFRGDLLTVTHGSTGSLDTDRFGFWAEMVRRLPSHCLTLPVPYRGCPDTRGRGE